jgi:hypothetical protein
MTINCTFFCLPNENPADLADNACVKFTRAEKAIGCFYGVSNIPLLKCYGSIDIEPEANETMMEALESAVTYAEKRLYSFDYETACETA